MTVMQTTTKPQILISMSSAVYLLFNIFAFLIVNLIC